MSTATVAKPGGGAGYDVGRSQGRCAVTGAVIEPGDRYMAALRETASGFERVDCSLAGWDQLDKSQIIAFWKTIQARAEHKKKVFVDDEVLCGLFERLSDTSEAGKLNFRFVLGLILMRKRLLVYESSRKVVAANGDQEIWVVRFRGREDFLDLLNPQLTEQQVLEVSQQMSEILNEEV